MIKGEKSHVSISEDSESDHEELLNESDLESTPEKENK